MLADTSLTITVLMNVKRDEFLAEILATIDMH
jgi:hypothetical protein